MAFIAGPYTGTYEAYNLGITENGFELENTIFGDPIRGDNMGQAIQDHVMRLGDVYANMVLQEFEILKTKGCYEAMWPLGHADAAALWGGIETVVQDGVTTSKMTGDLATAHAGALVLTAVAGTGAAGKMASLTAAKSLLAMDHTVRQLLASRLHNVPIRLQFYPTANGGGTRINWFTYT